MQLYEAQAKKILQDNGIRIPNGRTARTPEEATAFAKEIGGPVAIKAQVLSGSRGLAGLIRFSYDTREVASIASLIFGTVVRGETPTTLLIEEKMIITRELYCAITWDYPHKCPVLIASSVGGMDIETVARERPDEMIQIRVDPRVGFSHYMGRQLGVGIGLKRNQITNFANLVNALWNIFDNDDAELVEVNPLCLLPNNDFAAVDAKLTLDDKSLFRQTELVKRIPPIPINTNEGPAFRCLRAKERGIPTYIELEGEIGVVADGAGTGMLTLDLVKDAGGKTRSYCEMGGEATAGLMENALTTIVDAGNVKVILVNLIGGLNRMDEMAEGIVSYIRKSAELPIVVRMTGTREEEGREILTRNGIQYFDNLDEAIQETVRLR